MGDEGPTGYHMIVTAFFRFFIVVIIFIALIMFYRTFINLNIESFDAESELYINSFLYSKYGLSYLDETTGRVYPGTIDLTLFQDPMNGATKLEKAISFDEKTPVAAKFTLYNSLGNKLFKYNGQELEPVYYYELWYERWLPLAKSKLPGLGGVREKKKTFNVLVRDENSKNIPATMKISVLIPNT